MTAILSKIGIDPDTVKDALGVLLLCAIAGVLIWFAGTLGNLPVGSEIVGGDV